MFKNYIRKIVQEMLDEDVVVCSETGAIVKKSKAESVELQTGRTSDWTIGLVWKHTTLYFQKGKKPPYDIIRSTPYDGTQYFKKHAERLEDITAEVTKKPDAPADTVNA
jgi:hypothetical protein